MRPSELSAILWIDVDLETGKINIKVIDDVINLLKILPSRALGLNHVFVNKDGKPVNSKKWAEHNWAGPLKELEIRHRKFYATRHTFVTDMIKGKKKVRLPSPNTVARHWRLIQADYCGTLGSQAYGGQLLKAIKPDGTKVRAIEPKSNR